MFPDGPQRAVSQRACKVLRHGVRRPCVVEFAGIPGAGKTTAARRIADRLRMMSCPAVLGRPILGIHGGWKGHLSVIYEFLTTPWAWPLAWHLAVYAIGIRPLNLRRVGWLYVAIASVLALRRQTTTLGSPLTIWEEGPLHRIASLATEGTVSRHLTRRLLRVGRALASTSNWLVIFVPVRTEDALARIRMRPKGGSRFDWWDDELAQANLRIMGEALRNLVSGLSAGASPPVIVGDELSIDGKVRAISDRVLEWLGVTASEDGK